MGRPRSCSQRVVRCGVAAILLLGVGLSAPAQADGSRSKLGEKPEPSRLTLRFAALDRVSGEDPQLPATIFSRHRGEKLSATYQVCVRPDGSVLSVSRRSGIADADAIIINTLRTWRYPAQPPNTMTCSHEIFEFSL
jgi:hypothetical protein